MTDGFLLWLHAASTLYMVGLIWFVQIVHYPLMGQVGESGFRAYADRHQTLTSLVVAPPMLVELATTAWLLFDPPAGVSGPSIWIGASLLAVIWLSTVLLQMPCHGRLSTGFDLTVVRRLVNTNWIRTIAWSLRGCLVVGILRMAAVS